MRADEFRDNDCVNVNHAIFNQIKIRDWRIGILIGVPPVALDRGNVRVQNDCKITAQ